MILGHLWVFFLSLWNNTELDDGETVVYPGFSSYQIYNKKNVGTEFKSLDLKDFQHLIHLSSCDK